MVFASFGRHWELVSRFSHGSCQNYRDMVKARKKLANDTMITHNRFTFWSDYL
jgi:hypothetical protein